MKLTRALGLLMLTDGVAALIAPRTYLRKLETGTPLMDDLLEYFAQHSRETRAVAAGEVALGLWLTFR